MKLTNKEVQEIVARADDEYDRLKDRVHEQYDEIERLKEEYMILQNASDEVEEEKDKEIERLNNIINELEKYINETKLEEFEKAYGRRYGKTFTQAEVIICNMILNKLHKLKGSDKE